MGKTKDLGHLAHIVAYNAENHITVPAGITMHTNQLVASQAWVTTALGSYALSSSLSSYVPTSRTITINGTTFDLSANRNWDITSMIYPAAGIALSTGSAWGTSITNNSANWNTAFGWGNHASAGYLTGITSTLVTNALGFTPYNSTNPAGYITGISFANVSAKPTTLAGYGITDAASSTHNHDSLYVPLGRTITINGTAFDLSANRSWTITATETDTLATVMARGASTASGITFTAPGGTVLLKHAVSEVDAWIFQENAANWGIYWKNNPSGNHTFGGYTTIGAETFGMSAANASGNGVLTSNFVGATSAYAQWMLSNYTGYIWSASTIFAAGDMRAPIYYDSNDTAYYLNPAGGSRLRNLYVGDSGDDWSDPGGWGTQIRFSNGPHVKFVLHARSPGIEAGMYVHTPGSVFIGSFTSHDVSMMYAGNRKMQITNSYIYTDVYLEAAGSLRAPIFYDSNDTAYYLDPNSESSLYRFTSATMTRNAMNYLSINSPFTTRAAQAGPYQNGTMGWGTVDFNTVFSNWGSGFIDTWSSPGNAPGGSSHYVGIQSCHYNHQNSANVYGFQMACAGEADNRFFWRSAWPSMRGWVEMIHTGNIGSQSVSYANSAGNSSTVGGYSVSVAGSANTIPTRNASGYLIPENWIQLNGIYGLYSPTNGAHLYVNNASYGSWRIEGTRNGWHGIHFGGGNGMTLMMNEGEFGFHREGVGWTARFTSGTGYFNISGQAGSISGQANSATINATSGNAGNNIVLRDGNGDIAIGTLNTNHAFFGGGGRGLTSADTYGSYGNVHTYGTGQNGYSGYGAFDASGYRSFFMWEGGNGGIYMQSRGKWELYYFGGNDCTAITGSETYDWVRVCSNGKHRITNDSWCDATSWAYTFSNISDGRLKENIVTVDSALDKVLQLRGVYYNWIIDTENKKHIGLIAQETAAVCPEVVNYHDETDTYSVNYSELSGLFVESTKELNQKLMDANARIELLETKLNELLNA